mmetsp:Transcript_26616/g.61167  ORF Transcript_26616/g.61167 Transcript_26616/m.61167 type:complete len:990 (+) Transcript_26616:88-3057(+)
MLRTLRPQEARAGDHLPAWQQTLQFGLGELARQTVAAPGNQGGAVPKETIDEGSLQLDFGYVGSMDSKSVYAKYDIRDEICMHVGGFRHGDVLRSKDGRDFVVIGVKPVNGKLQLWFQPKKQSHPAARTLGASISALQKALTPVEPFRESLQEMSVTEFDKFEDADGERLSLCRECRLPVGELGYNVKGRCKGDCVHGECMANLVLQDVQAQDRAERIALGKTKKESRASYAIGWDASKVPSNDGPLSQLESSLFSKGMCCLVLNEEDMSVTLAPTLEPAAAVNLEYLSLALKVRRSEGVEPLFSLDPVDPKSGIPADRANSMQRKRFEPSWLDGTSMGEVLFQADYHLKELSMGEHDQPVVGMRSCFDMVEDGAQMASSWKAREWFVVKDADVMMSEDNALMPSVQMGVEAREQILGPQGLEDAKLTRADHPLVKYAAAFSSNFDLIAERRSVVFHLREVARAAALAKFLVESNVQLPDTWYELAQSGTPSPYPAVPMLWNERSRSVIRVKGGTIVDAKKEADTHGVYGGVELGMTQISLAAPRRVPGGVVASTLLALIHAPFPARAQPKARPVKPAVAPSLFGAAAVAKPRRAAGAVPSMPVSMAPSGRRHDFLSGSSMLASSRTLPREPVEGVDLSLDDINLSTARKSDEQAEEGIAVVDVEAFWESLKKQNLQRSEEQKFDKMLLRSVYNPHLSDRRADKENFVPPNTSTSYIQKLRKLVKDEDTIRKQRKDTFISAQFSPDRPGAVFPTSWTPLVEVEQDCPRPQWLPDGARLNPAHSQQATFLMSTAEPSFARSTEDGSFFRIYRSNELEVRTIQEVDEKETVGAIFELAPLRRSQAWDEPSGQPVSSQEPLAKLTMLVERATRHGKVLPSPHYHPLVVAETQKGLLVVTDLLENGSATWAENPASLASRTSLAKAVRCVDCSGSGLTVQDLRDYYAYQQEQAMRKASHAERKQYAQGMLAYVESRKLEMKREQLSWAKQQTR